MPEAIKKCQVCGKPIPKGLHPARRTCSDRCMKINFRNTQTDCNKRHRAKLKRIVL